MTENEKIIEEANEIAKGRMYATNEVIRLQKELEQYRAIGTIDEFMALKLKEHNYDNCHNLTCRRKCQNDGYNKAIDEFVIKLKRVRGYGLITNFDRPFGVTFNKLDEIAEEMKGGAE